MVLFTVGRGPTIGPISYVKQDIIYNKLTSLPLDITTKLFVDWDLETWANVLEIVGFLIAAGALAISLFIKSELSQLKTSYIFDKRIKKHIANLQSSASNINQLLNDYDNNRNAIRTEFSNCLPELEDLIVKISLKQAWKSRKLISFIRARRDKPFVAKGNYKTSFIFHISKYPKRLYQTTYDDVWIVYDRLIEIIRQIQNIKQNKDKSL